MIEHRVTYIYIVTLASLLPTKKEKHLLFPTPYFYIIVGGGYREDEMLMLLSLVVFFLTCICLIVHILKDTSCLLFFKRMTK